MPVRATPLGSGCLPGEAGGHRHGRRLSPLALLLRLPIHAYRLLVSPVMAPSCRFAPSCSEYALDALATHGAVRGTWLALRRILRCNPWGGSGFDPVPAADQPPAQRP